MMRGLLFVAIVLAAGCGPNRELVNIQQVSPGIFLDIRYATANNFTEQKVYDRAVCYLRPATAAKLSRVQAELERQSMGLMVYDCYRPHSVQYKFWALIPDERYVANPADGSNHNRGAAVDLTLVDRNGTELPMPSEFDVFTERAHRNYRDASPEAARNRETLERAMVRHGFLPLPTEWWHFDDTECRKYPILDIGFGQLR